MLREENGGSEQPISSDPGHFPCLRKMVAEEVKRISRPEMQLMGVKTAPQEINPDLIVVIRKLVKEEVQKLLTEGTRNDMAEERSLHLKFLDEVSGPVQTSKEFRAVNDGPPKVALFDAAGNIVNSGPESSAEVEILLIDASGNVYKKHEPPFPGSEVWRLKEIGRGGEPRKYLEREGIKTVLDFLFWLSVNPKRLQEITGAGDNRWKTIVAHARTCKIDDKKMYCHKFSPEPHMGVIYDSLGELKGVIDESHSVPIDNLSADEKVHARKLLSLVLEPSAFVERYKTFFNDEASLVQQYPHKSSDANSSTICSIQQCWNGIDSENINSFQTAEPGCSSQSISPNNIYDSLESRDVGELCNDTLGPIPGPENIPTDLDYEMCGFQPSTHLEILEADPRVNPLCDMDDFLLNGGLSQNYSYGNNWSDNVFGLSPRRMTPTCVLEEYRYIQMSNADDERAAAAVVSTGNASNRWTQLFYVLTWRFSISRRVSLNVDHPKRKKQRVG